MQGILKKMQSRLKDTVEYFLPVGDQQLALNPLMGHPLSLEHSGKIFCIHCGRATKKSFNQGYCYPCFRDLAACDSCIIKPEQCHYHEGTCREPQWAEQHCMQPHVVYLANSSGLKVGITRASQIPTRWIDQGAVQAIPVLIAGNRYISGLIEMAAKRTLNDRTDWRRMLKGNIEPIDLSTAREALLEQLQEDIRSLRQRFGQQAVCGADNDTQTKISFPVQHYPEKIVSLNFDKTPQLGGSLLGIKGQYLIFDTGVINVRKFAGYEVRVTSG